MEMEQALLPEVAEAGGEDEEWVGPRAQGPEAEVVLVLVEHAFALNAVPQWCISPAHLVPRFNVRSAAVR